ncbi:MAG: dipeptidase [Anaerolineales bacterium]
MLIIDSHLDLSWNAMQWGRDIRLSAYTIRAQESGTPGAGRAQNTVCLPELRRGRVAVSFATILSRCTGMPYPLLDYPSVAQAYGVGRGQLAYYRALEREGHIRIIESLDVLNRHIAEWEAWDAAHPQDAEGEGDTTETPTLGFVISMESADPIMTPDQLEDWFEAGLRVIGPAHYGPGRYAGGTGTENGISEIGVALLKEMQRLGIVLDMTHLCDQAFWEALEHFDGPVLASHNNCRALVPHQRQFTDDQLRAIIKREGVIGAAFDIWMMIPDWTAGKSTNQQASIATAADHIDHVCQLAGNAHHAAIGSDLDGGFGRESSPHDLDTIADLQSLTGILAGRGYAQDDIAHIMYGNWVRLLRRACA